MAGLLNGDVGSTDEKAVEAHDFLNSLFDVHLIAWQQFGGQCVGNGHDELVADGGPAIWVFQVAGHAREGSAHGIIKQSANVNESKGLR